MDLKGDRLSAFPASFLPEIHGDGYGIYRDRRKWVAGLLQRYTQRESWEGLAPLISVALPDQPAGCSPRFK